MRCPFRLCLTLLGVVLVLAAPGVAAGHFAPPHGGHGTGAQPPGEGPDELHNMRLLANVGLDLQDPEIGVNGSDLAFWGTRAYAGNYGGFRIIDVRQPSSPRLLSDVRCFGPQNDISVWGNELVFLSVDQPLTSERCGGQPTDFGEMPDAWEGIRIFDVSNPRDPVFVTGVATDCGSHTHTLIPDLANDRVLLYVSSFNLGFDDGPNCALPTEEEPVSHSKISIVEVPLDDPRRAAVINEPGEMFEGGQACYPTLSNPLVPTDEFFICNETDDESLPGATRGCHDIQVLYEARLAACSALSEGQLWDISDLEEPNLLKRFDNPNFEAWHNAVFTWDGRIVAFSDEAGGGGEPWCKPGDRDTIGADWFYPVEGESTQPLGHYKPPRTTTGICTAHNGALLPVRGRYLYVQAWYELGTSIADFTDPANAQELAYFQAGDPDAADDVFESSFAWSSYAYRGFVYANDIFRGLDVLLWRDLLRRRAMEFSHDNPQTQMRVLFGPSGGGGGEGPH